MRRPLLLLVACLLVAGTACGRPEQVPISQASLSDDGRTLTLGVGSCNAEHNVDVDESADEVVVTVTARGADGNDCMDEVTAVLQKKLDGRALIDGSSGAEFGVD